MKKCSVVYCRNKSNNKFCEKHQKGHDSASIYNKEVRNSPNNIKYTKFYNSKEWKKTREIILLNNPMCNRCMMAGLLSPAVIVHHIIELKDDWELRTELSNLEGICRKCHGEIDHKKRY